MQQRIARKVMLSVVENFKVELEGIEPSSKRGTNKLSTCLVLTWFSSIGRIKTTNLKLIL